MVPHPPFPGGAPLLTALKNEQTQTCRVEGKVGSLPQEEQLADELSRGLREKKPMH